MSQFLNPKSPSQEDFNTLSEQMGNIAKVKTGVESCTYGSGQYTDVSFGYTFNHVPIVLAYVCADVNGVTGTGFTGISSVDTVAVSNVSTTGCRIWHERADASTNPAYFQWVAIEFNYQN